MTKEEITLLEQFVNHMGDISKSLATIATGFTSPEMGDALKGLANIPEAINNIVD